jgi:hypothetical protein
MGSPFRLRAGTIVSEVRAATRNGHWLQGLIDEAGLRYVKALKSEGRPKSGE